jgi:hypothetical protein
MGIYRNTSPWAFFMNDFRKTQALIAWETLFTKPAIRMDAEEQYEELLRLADDFDEQGIISREERTELIRNATAFYAQSVEGVGGGT